MVHDGLRVVLTGKQVIVQCATMVTWHAKRAYKYEQELVQLQNIKGSTGEMQTMTDNIGGNMEREAKNKIKEHKNKVKWFEFFMKNINEEDEYALSEIDLESLGYIERPW